MWYLANIKKLAWLKLWLNNDCYSRGIEMCISINWEILLKYLTPKSSLFGHRMVNVQYWFDKTLFTLAFTPPPGLTTSHDCPQAFPAHCLSHLAVGNGNVWITHARTAPVTPKSDYFYPLVLLGTKFCPISQLTSSMLVGHDSVVVLNASEFNLTINQLLNGKFALLNILFHCS